MKVGIVTIFDSENFGNKLQNYALQQVLLHYADEVITLKNKPKFRSILETLRRGSNLAESIWLNRLMGKGRKAKILAFQKKYIHTSRRCYCCQEDTPVLHPKDRCDLYCAGSDQVWNPELDRTGGFNFLSFAESRGFSYGASFGTEAIQRSNEAQAAHWLTALSHICVREETGKQLAESLTGRNDVQLGVDPTMLLPWSHWQTLARKPRKELPERVLLLYFLGRISPERRDMIQETKAQHGLTIIDPLDRSSPFYEIGPESFLYLISQANLVFTDSFHASVFSFLAGRPLVIFDREGEQQNMGSRLDTFAHTFCLVSRRVKNGTLPNHLLDADYARGYEQLKKEREKARDYFNQVFREAKGHG